MYRILFLILMLIPLPLNAEGWFLAVGTGGCSYVEKDSSTSGTANVPVGKYATRTYSAVSWTTGSAYSCKQIKFKHAVSGTITGGNSYAKIWDNNAGEPGNLLGTSGGIALTSISDGEQVTYTFSTPISLENATVYHAGIYVDTVDEVNYIELYFDDSGTDDFNYGNDGSSWTNADATSTIWAVTYACE